MNISYRTRINLLFFILILLPNAILKFHYFSKFNNIIESILIVSAESYLVITVVFVLFKLIDYKYTRFLIPIIFSLCSVTIYYLYSFSKGIDAGVIADIFEVDKNQIYEYISLEASIYFILSGILACYFTFYDNNHSLLSLKIIVITLCPIFLISILDINILNGSIGNHVINDYAPLNIGSSIAKYFKKHSRFDSYKNIRNDKIKNIHLDFQDENNNIIVLIIGESVRSDYMNFNGEGDSLIPLLSKRKNIIGFNAIACSTSTRESLPCMLTNAMQPDWEEGLQSVSIINMFKHAKYFTSWIGTQGVYGTTETTYGSIATDADYIIEKRNIRNNLFTGKPYDEHMINYLQKVISNDYQNKLIILHMSGSHWNLEERYPDEFKIFTPVCIESAPRFCEENKLMNSYNNSILYTDYVIDNIIQELESFNSLLIFASDHGFSLGENGIFGNAYRGNNTPSEQLNIPIFFWYSETYYHHNKSMIENIKKNSKMIINHDYIFHSILGCSNIHSNIIESSLNLCH